MGITGLLTFYLGSSATSAIFNLYLNYQYHKRNSEEAKKNLEFEDLSETSCDNLEEIKNSNFHDNKITALYSFIPLYNIIYSTNYMLTSQEELDEIYQYSYSLIINTTNSFEREVRTKYLNHLKKLRDSINIPDEYIESLNKGDLNISENDYKKILKLNNIKYDENILYSEKDN